MPRKPKQPREEIAELYNEASFGQFVEIFLKENELGQYIMEGIREYRQEKLESLASVDFSKHTDIVKLQAEIKVVEQINSILVDVIERGRQAKQLIEETHGT